MPTAPNLDEIDAEQADSSAAPEAAPKATAPPRLGSIVATVSADPEFVHRTRWLLVCLEGIRAYQFERRHDTVDGARQRTEEIANQMARDAVLMPPVERIREQQAELARLATVTLATEHEVRRAIRVRFEVVDAAFKSWSDTALSLCRAALAERQKGVADFARQYGLPPFPTPVCDEVIELIRQVEHFLRVASDEFENKPRLLNEHDVVKLGACPIYSAPPPSRLPSTRPAVSALELFGVDCSSVHAAGRKAQD